MTDNTVYIYSYIIYISEGHDPSFYRYFFHEQSIFFHFFMLLQLPIQHQKALPRR